MDHIGPGEIIGIAGLFSSFLMAWVARGQQKRDGGENRVTEHERRITVLETDGKNTAKELAEVKQIVNKIDDKMDRLVSGQNKKE